MDYSYRIINGRVIDPASRVDAIKDVCIRNSRIVANGNGEAAETIDASGCLVLPGLIDFHAHLDRAHSDLGIHPDLMTLPNGVTSAVDAGSGGTANWEGFYKDVVMAADITMKSYVSVAATGIITEQYFENPDPDLYDVARLEYFFERYRSELLGLKVRIGKLFSKEFGIKPLVRAKHIAEKLSTTVCAHAVHPECPYDEILAVLDRGDVLCHCFQAKGEYNILDASGGVGKAARRARERGVIFDAASGRANYSYAIAATALVDGFLPDVISTDVVTHSIYKPKVFSLPYVMSGYLAVGMPLEEVVRATTETPARLMGMAGHIGTLAPGALADVAIIKLRERPITFKDQFGNSVPGKGLLVPQMTIKAGRGVFTNIEFSFWGA